MRAWWRSSSGDEELTELRAEVERLTAETVRLRLERQRPYTLSRLSSGLAVATPEAVATQTPCGVDAGDDAAHLLAQAQASRAAVLDLVQQLKTAATLVERQLLTDVPMMELDRRVGGRRAADPGVVGTAVEDQQVDPELMGDWIDEALAETRRAARRPMSAQSAPGVGDSG